MKISELIEFLEGVKEREGDIVVMVDDCHLGGVKPHGYLYPPDSIEFACDKTKQEAVDGGMILIIG